jgi:hypothetical protein
MIRNLKIAQLCIDSMALINAISKPKAAVSFGDLVAPLCIRVFRLGRWSKYKHIDVMFNRHFTTSTKSGTRNVVMESLVSEEL